MFTRCNGASRWEYSNQGTTNYVSVTVIDVHNTQITCRICAVSFTPNSMGTFIYCGVTMKVKLCCEIQCKKINSGNFEGLKLLKLSQRPRRRRECSIKIPLNEFTFSQCQVAQDRSGVGYRAHFNVFYSMATHCVWYITEVPQK